MVKIFSMARRPPRVKESFPTGKRLVERAGFMSAKQRIENILAAGDRLLSARMEQYDYGDETDSDDMVIDPTRNGGFDITDAQEIVRDVSERFKARSAEKAEQEKQGLQKSPSVPTVETETGVRDKGTPPNEK